LLSARGNALKALGRDDEALSCFERALALQPDFLPALYERGTLLAAGHRIADWFAGFRRFSERWVGAAAWSAVGGEPNPPPPHKGLHDTEQRDYQREYGIAAIGERPYIVDGERLSGPAINPLNAAAAAIAWRDGKIVVVDNLLTDEALAAMRRYCWGSTMWRSVYNAGYIGAFPEQGFNSPLLAQIVEEFRTVFSEICGDHALKYVWGFKYDSALEGIAIHADAAAVNVNFWITPDDANLDPESGGLVVWDVAAPLDWDFTKFNTDENAIRDFLAQSGAKPVVVPYRANRAVIFDSDLFHQTDTIRFKPGYRNRRINVTLLYGERDPARC
jgi:tetratricopeptide (TPR) repeat protein